MIEENFSLENLDLKLDIDFNQAKVPATSEGLKMLLDELTLEVYGTSEDSQVLKFYSSEGFYVVERLSSSTENTAAKPCKTESITCHNAEEVKAALIKIIGDGTRDVIIKYDRKLLSVEISYTYQDC